MSNLKDSCYSCDYFPLVSGSSTNLVFEKKIYSRMNYIKLNTNRPNQTNIYHVEPKRFVLFVRLLPFGQWVFDKSRVRKKYIRV